MGPIHQNPLRTRADVEAALLQLVEPLTAHFTCGDAGLHLGNFAAHYGGDSARMEAFSRVLWGLGPLWVASGEKQYFPRFRQGLINGVNPEHPGYWGKLVDYDQKFVEMAPIALLLFMGGDQLALEEQDANHLHAWLEQINVHSIPVNNWLFFRVLVNAACRKMGWTYHQVQMDADLAQLDQYYLEEGWYFDGQATQIDYYIPFGMHYYGLIYAHFMADIDPERCCMFKDRAAQFAKEYLYWFEDSGAAVPFGRSLTYRFAQGSFFSALAFAGVEAVPWGVMKSRVLAHLRYWFAQPIFTSDGLLTVGYAYPNLCTSENYNAPGSPYWALKIFLCLALSEEHPFWQSEEIVPVLEPQHTITQARMILCRDERQVQLFPTGQHCVNQLGNCAAKYEKLCYSSAFGFSVPRGESLEEGAFDNGPAFSEQGEDRWRMTRGFIEWNVDAHCTRRVFSPLRGVRVEVVVTPLFPSHRREYLVTTDRPIDMVDGGFAIAAENHGDAYLEDMVVWEDSGVTAQFPWGESGIICMVGDGMPLLIKAFPNTNVLAAVTRIPMLKFHLESGQHRIVTIVTGDIRTAV